MTELFGQYVNVLEPWIKSFIYHTSATVIAFDDNFEFVKRVRDDAAKVWQCTRPCVSGGSARLRRRRRRQVPSCLRHALAERTMLTRHLCASF
jgi:hypothetical protein